MKITFYFLSGKEESLQGPELVQEDIDSLFRHMQNDNAWWIKMGGRKLMFRPDRLDYVEIWEECDQSDV